jgi:SAM-dependent methyltransferase|eukprot:g5838.t1
MPHFGDPEYWRRYYAEQAQDPFHSHEFLQDFQGIKRPIMAQLKKKSKILHVGCGNSYLSEDIYDCGITNITNVDVSDKVLKLMTIRNQSEGRKIKQVVADFAKDVVPNFTTPDYDVVVDKNVLDCFMSIPNDHNTTAMKYVKNIYKQLKAGGLYIMLSFSSENARLPILGYKTDPDFVYRLTKGIKWKRVTCIRIPKQHTGMKPGEAEKIEDEEDISHFLYICEKPGITAVRKYRNEGKNKKKELAYAVENALRPVVQVEEEDLFGSDSDDDM